MQGEPPTEARTPTGAVFLSYASQDAEAARRICDALRAADVEVWFDQSELRGGDAWDRKIRAQIHDCRLFIPVISANTERRDEGYFRREWALAADRTRDMAHKRAFIVPVAIDGTPERGASVPEKFHELQWTRLPGGETPPVFVDRIKRLLKPEDSSVTAAGATIGPLPGPSVVRSPLSRAIGWGAAVVAAIAFAYFVGDKFWLSKRASPRSTASSVVAGSETSPLVPAKSIAVLPFADMSERHDEEYFADGMAEELIDRLAQISELRVISRTSAFQFKEKGEDVRTIGEKLAVANILEGTVRRSGNQLRIDVKLVSASDGSQRWSQRYDRRTSEVFKIQDEIAADVVLALKSRLAKLDLPDNALTANGAAHDLFLEGRFLVERGAPGDAEFGISKYEQALKEDPSYAIAWAEIAWAELWTTPQNYDGCASAASRAVELRPDLGQTHASRGWCELLLGFNWNLAEAELKKALDLEPNNARALYGKGRLARALHKTDESVRYYQATLQRDPINSRVLGGLALSLTAAGRPAEAVQSARKMLDLSPGAVWGHWFLAYALLRNGEPKEALSEIALEPLASLRFSCEALIQRALGNQQAQDAALRGLLASNDPNKPYFVAQVFAARGDSKAAIEWLEQARLGRIGWFSEVNTDQAFDVIRGDPAFVAYLRRVKLL